MIKKIQGLKTNFEFNITRKYGEYHTGQFFHLYALKPTNYKGISKVGIVVSTKMDKRATVRNRVKRLFKQSIEKYLDQIKDKNMWIVIHPRANSRYRKYEEISADLNKALPNITLP